MAREELSGRAKATHIFGYHAGNETTIPRHEEIRNWFIEFMDNVDAELVAAGAHPRDIALVWTKMQEASMFTHAALAFTAPVTIPAP
jgi:hypothetical protein